MLNMIIRWTPGGSEYDADPRQAEQLIRDLGMSGSKAVGTLGVKTTSEQLAADNKLAYHRHKPYGKSPRGQSTSRLTVQICNTPRKKCADGCRARRSQRSWR